MNDKRSTGTLVSVAISILLIPLLILLLFAPLLMAFVEQAVFGTRHVEQMCETLHIHGALTVIYRPIIDFCERVGRMF